MSKAIDLAGQSFGRLRVLSRNSLPGFAPVFWLCRCECGQMRSVRSQDLRIGHTTSCGCAKPQSLRSAATTHGQSNNSEYAIWQGVKNRCLNPNVKGYPGYGGSGVTICDRWRHSFENFIADMGPRPSPGHSIDRFPDPFGNYEPNNCRWATRLQQATNKRNTRRVVYRGVEMPLTEANRLAGNIVHYETAWTRINSCNWPVSKALETPIHDNL